MLPLRVGRVDGGGPAGGRKGQTEVAGHSTRKGRVQDIGQKGSDMDVKRHMGRESQSGKGV